MMRYYTKKIWHGVFVVFLITLISCTSNQEKELKIQKEIYSELFPSVLDEITDGKKTKDKVIFFNERPKDNLLKFILDQHLNDTLLINHLKTNKPYYYDLIVGLDAIREKPVDVSFLDNKSTKNGLKTITEDTHQKKILKEKYESIFGFFCLSNIYFNKEQNRGIFYCYFDCGKGCCNGYFIYLKRNGNDWIVDKKVVVAESNSTK